MRPDYLAPKLTESNRVEIRRLRAEDRKTWTLVKLAKRFGVHRSTISHVLKDRRRLSLPAELEGARLAIDTAGVIDTRELVRLKMQEWNRTLLVERDLARQQRLMNLLKTALPMVEGEKPKAEKQPVPDAPMDREALRREREERMRKALIGAEDSHCGVTCATDAGTS